MSLQNSTCDTTNSDLPIRYTNTNKNNLNDGAARDFHDFSICAANVHTNFSTKIYITQDQKKQAIKLYL
jgi:hypothetical protein